MNARVSGGVPLGGDSLLTRGLQIRGGPVPASLQLLADWELAISDAADSRVVAYVFRSSFDHARRFRLRHGQALSRVRVIFVVAPGDLSVERQLDADEVGVELWVDSPSLQRQLEAIVSSPPLRVKPDESENFDADMFRMLRQVSPTSDVKQLLMASQSLLNVSKLDQQRTIKLAGKAEIHNFFHQVL